MNLIADGLYADSNNIHDKYFKTKSVPFVRNERIILDVYLNYDDNYLNFQSDICQIFFSNILIPFQENIISAWMYRGEDYQTGSAWYGAQSCNTGKNCLKNMTLKDINNTCNEYTEEHACTLAVEF